LWDITDGTEWVYGDLIEQYSKKQYVGISE